MSFPLVPVPRSELSAAPRLLLPPPPSVCSFPAPEPCAVMPRTATGWQCLRAFRSLAAARGWAAGLSFTAQTELCEHSGASPAGQGAREMESLAAGARAGGLHTSRARCGPQADLCCRVDEGRLGGVLREDGSNPPPAASVNTTAERKRGNPAGTLRLLDRALMA